MTIRQVTLDIGESDLTVLDELANAFAGGDRATLLRLAPADFKKKLRFAQMEQLRVEALAERGGRVYTTEETLKLIDDLRIVWPDAQRPAPPLTEAPLTDEEVRVGAEALAEHDNPGDYERGEIVQRWDDYVAASRAMLEAVRAIRQNRSIMTISPALRGLTADAISVLQGARWAIADAADHVPSQPGLYAIYGDEQALAELQLTGDSDQPLYVGKAEESLVARDLNTHFAVNSGVAARTGSSTVRRSFAALLRDVLDLRAVPRSLANPGYFTNYGLAEGGDARLTEWMHARLTLAVWAAPVGMPVSLAAVETAVIRHFTPPINLAKNPRKLSRLTHARTLMAAEASRWRPEHPAGGTA
jgi:hypothetical protein